MSRDKWLSDERQIDIGTREGRELIGADKHTPLFFSMSPRPSPTTCDEVVLERLARGLTSKGEGSFSASIQGDHTVKVMLTRSGSFSVTATSLGIPIFDGHLFSWQVRRAGVILRQGYATIGEDDTFVLWEREGDEPAVV